MWGNWEERNTNMDAIFTMSRGGEGEVRVAKEEAGSGVMVLTTGATMVLEEEREVLPRPVDTLRADKEKGHSSGLKGKERGRETRPLNESCAKFPTCAKNWAEKRVGRELEVFKKKIREIPVREARGETTDTNTSGRTPQDGVDTDIRCTKSSSNARSSRGEGREYWGGVRDRGPKVKAEGITNPNGLRKVEKS